MRSGGERRTGDGRGREGEGRGRRLGGECGAHQAEDALTALTRHQK